MTPRAPRLSPDERRAALVDATVPLLLEHGRAVTTRQIAEAAGIAEGTIFRVFATKEELVDAALDAAFDPQTCSRSWRPSTPPRPCGSGWWPRSAFQSRFLRCSG